MDKKLADRIVKHAVLDLEEETSPSMARVSEVVTNVAGHYGIAGADLEELVRKVQELFTVTVDGGGVLSDPTNHIEWLSERKSQIEWGLWSRYRRYLLERQTRPPASVESLDDMSEKILRQLENPERSGEWDTRGMVVGRVQSGKTASYTALITKALDAGYKFIVVLAGMQDSLRSQTQLRMDEGVVGYDTKFSRSFENKIMPFGVGTLRDTGNVLLVHSLTTSAPRGDFGNKIAQQTPASLMQSSEPVILVVKKNKKVLENLAIWAKRRAAEEVDGRLQIRNRPMLLIDDEADNASIDTKYMPKDEDGASDPDYQASAINAKIRELLKLFEKSAYVAYTATPFANVFIPHYQQNEQLGDDIFPRNFIVDLPAPSDYIGAAKIFGIPEDDPDDESADVKPMPIFEAVTDIEDVLPSNHRKDFEPESLPTSLQRAIDDFILACAARRALGQIGEHNSMLVHVTRFVNVQEHLRDLVEQYVRHVKGVLTHGTGGDDLQRLQQRWQDNFEIVTKEFQEQKWVKDVPTLTWSQVEAQLYEAIDPIVVQAVHGQASDLEYEENKEKGLNVIAVGGNKLSRGLTLEGLTVSYFVRTSKMYDTLMQMGRWFGYKPGYLQLCRLYTTQELKEAYKHITRASIELTRQFNEMAAIGETPSDFGLKVRSDPNGLLMVTAQNKMRGSREVFVSFAASLVDIKHYDTDPHTISLNYRATNELVEQLGTPTKKKGNYLWEGIPASKITSYLRNYKVATALVTSANGGTVADYIEAQNKDDELIEWTVAVISSNRRDASRADVGGHQVGLSKRSGNKSSDESVFTINNSRLISPSDEYLDFSDDEVKEMTEESVRRWEMGESKGRSKKKPTRPNPQLVRESRDKRKGYLMIYTLDPAGIVGEAPIVGYAVSFPGSKKATKVAYRINTVYQETEQ
jgi:hypothetical protein